MLAGDFPCVEMSRAGMSSQLAVMPNEVTGVLLRKERTATPNPSHIQYLAGSLKTSSTRPRPGRIEPITLARPYT
jgi:hypothetical protein